MNKDKQRIKIAEACGWRIYKSNGIMYYERPGGNVYNHESSLSYLPDYLNDLNAMHEAEKVIPHDKGAEYARNLLKIVPYGDWMHTTTAAKRAEAFLKTMNLWE
jgi:hypothetical protein